MDHTLHLALTDELRAYVDANCGDGTMFATPDEFIRDLLRQRKRQEDAERARDAILAGYRDAVAERTVEYKVLPAGMSASGKTKKLNAPSAMYAPDFGGNYIELTEAEERSILEDALEKCKWNRRKAAELLSVSYQTLRRRIARHGLSREA